MCSAMERTAELFIAGSGEPEIVEEAPPAAEGGGGDGTAH